MAPAQRQADLVAVLLPPHAKPPDQSRPVVPTGLFSPGERVEHHQWGPGLVLEAEADRLTVLFDDSGSHGSTLVLHFGILPGATVPGWH